MTAGIEAGPAPASIAACALQPHPAPSLYFFVGEQNRRLLTNDDGSLTPRGQQVIGHTPLGRFGNAEELVGTLLWLASDASSFVSGAVVPVDGGFSAFSGV